VDSPSLLTDAYLGTLAVLAVYGAHRLWLLWRFRWPGAQPAAVAPDRISREEGAVVGGDAELPRVAVQLPLYNERTVAARLVRAVGALDWPADRLEIQVLDDSTDETREVVDAEVAALRASGLDARVLRREERVGYKAGALDFGMRSSSADLFCIFDADFLPPRDFLRRTVPGFADPAVGMVQARWEHVNREESGLTRAQSTLLDGHFVIEHKVRSDSELFFNFNGTAGVWRRAAIDDAGGWQHDTLTEDLDLSYRAQLSGWRFVYLPFVAAPAEVPPDIAAFKSQQHRWAKGSVQVARKLGGRIARADVPLRVKLEAAAHLTSNTGYPFMLLLALLLPFSIAEGSRFAGGWHLAMFVLCTASVVLFYDRSQRALGRQGSARLRDVPTAMALGIGMSVSQTRAILEGLFTRTGEFVRTPKRGDAPGVRHYSAILRGLPGVELFVAAWFAWGIANAVRLELWASLPFLFLFFWGFAWVGSLSLRDWARARGATRVP
jgi:cellulose synthase/poly-beta-1,6-N-acetylglucosamine synthase-like glycosyltransferase